MPSAFDPTPAAALLAEHMNSGTRLAELPEAVRPSSLAEGHDVQERIAALAGQDGGLADRVAGWKLGLGSANAMKGAQIDRPVIGRIFESRLHSNNAEIQAPAGTTGMIEIEIAFTFNRDIEPGETVDNPRDVIGAAHLVSEIVLSRYIDRTTVGLPSFVADNVGFHALVIGPEIAIGDIDAIAQSMAVSLDGEAVAGGLTGDDAIDPLAMVGVLIAHARDRGLAIAKGERVTTGTLSKPFDAPVPSRVEARTAKGPVGFRLVGA